MRWISIAGIAVILVIGLQAQPQVKKNLQANRSQRQPILAQAGPDDGSKA